MVIMVVVVVLIALIIPQMSPVARGPPGVGGSMGRRTGRPPPGATASARTRRHRATQFTIPEIATLPLPGAGGLKATPATAIMYDAICLNNCSPILMGMI